MDDINQLKFLEISEGQDFTKCSEQITKLTNRSADDLFYLLYKNKKSRSFCIMNDDEIVGFQGFVYKPIIYKERIVPSYRSEFTIAKPELHGTGVFTRFYKYTMDSIIQYCKEVYFWGETRHRGWKNFGFKIIKRYTFYQIFSKSFKSKVGKPEIINNTAVNILSVLFSIINPFRYLMKRNIKIAGKITYDQFKAYALNSNNFKLQLYMDEESFKWRYLENKFHKYLFLTYRESLIIVWEKGSEAILADIYTKSTAQYMILISYLLRKYMTVIVHGNYYAFYKTPYFWGNLLMGFIPFIGGGSFVECNLNAPIISWKDIPLLESWEFGV